jgi:hypothetical protein
LKLTVLAYLALTVHAVKLLRKTEVLANLP